MVVGGTSGIGRTIAIGLAEAGADVVATARRQELVDEVAAEIERAAGGRCASRRMLATARRSIACTTRCSRRSGASTSSSVPAGMTKRVPTLEMDEADWHRIIETNLTGTLRAYGRSCRR